jgi:glutamate N-acetyltransferase/amino-acid N-acetyltransferase
MTSLRRSPEKVRLPLGFSFSAVAAGIKASGRPDLALAEAAKGATAAALFTQNRVVAAPVEVGRASLLSSRYRVRAVLVNSGNANCATGRAGIHACQQVCRETATALGALADEIFPSSTGIIGVPLAAEKITVQLPKLIATRSASRRGILAFAHAIMTTDTRAKIASRRFSVRDDDVTVLGIAKGAGMIHPQLATMLVYLFTDLRASAAELRPLLREACDSSLNCMSIDGDTSTNDTVLLLASGASGVRLRDAGSQKKFAVALNTVCQSLAQQIISDGEGVQHVIRLVVEQASSRKEALLVARTIAHSMLVGCARRPRPGAYLHWQTESMPQRRCLPVQRAASASRSRAACLRYSRAARTRTLRGTVSYHRPHRRVCADQCGLLHVKRHRFFLED